MQKVALKTPAKTFVRFCNSGLLHSAVLSVDAQIVNKMASINKSPLASPLKQVTNTLMSASPQKRFKSENQSEISRNTALNTKSQPVLRFAKLTDQATTPTRGSKYAAGYDLYSAHECVIPARGKSLIKTDIQIELPSGCYGRVAPRSGLAHKHFLDVGAGVIDEDYRGNVGVIMFNFNSEDYKVEKGDRVAQLICERIYYPELQEVESLTDTERGSGGYGSTGKK